MRADARRNYEAIVRVAIEAFAEHGTNTSLDDIANRAGVGPGTLYRHFPNRDCLLEAALVDSRYELLALAERLLHADDADAALDEWMFALARHAGAWDGLADSIAQSLNREKSPLGASCGEVITATQKLLERASTLGTVTADATARELFIMAGSLAWAADRAARGNGRGSADDELPRLLSLLMRGLR
ncbi:TetR/AcrR family transcriptional regulator [Agromyces albus]|uniref:TetR/AcrR family transcriptional regulator n=2 Tax=Agromyces albus TaxID=205332 RepID=A0A4Q2KU35_9MICO|nr:TetR/AcrR family transcriptional regulator [Agromyces albus]